MGTWTDDDLLELDAKYAAEGIAFHARPLRAAMDVLVSCHSSNVG